MFGKKPQTNMKMNLLCSFPIKSELETPTAENLHIGVDTTAKYLTNKISDFF